MFAANITTHFRIIKHAFVLSDYVFQAVMWCALVQAFTGKLPAAPVQKIKNKKNNQKQQQKTPSYPCALSLHIYKKAFIVR